MKDNKKIEQTVSGLVDIVDTLMNVMNQAIPGNNYTNPERKLLHECQDAMKELKHNWQDKFD